MPNSRSHFIYFCFCYKNCTLFKTSKCFTMLFSALICNKHTV